LNGSIYSGYEGYTIAYEKLINLVVIIREPMDYENDNWIIPSTKKDAPRDFEGWDPALHMMVKYRVNT